MKKIIFFIFFFECFAALPAFAQFYSDEVLLYVEAGVNPHQTERDYRVIVIGYNSYNDEIRNWNSSGSEVRNTISQHPEYFDSPNNIPDKINCLSKSYRSPKYSKRNDEASTSKYVVFTGHNPAGSNAWGQSWKASTVNYAFSMDKKQMILWYNGEEDRRTTYILTDLSDFDPASQSSQSYDFLE